MLEAGQIDLYEEAYQRGYEIGVTRSQIGSISMVIEDIKISLSEEKWMRYKKAEEEKHRKYVREHPEQENDAQGLYDGNGSMVRERWLESCHVIAEIFFLEPGCWDDIVAFIRKYPQLPTDELAERIVRESEYKYV